MTPTRKAWPQWTETMSGVVVFVLIISALRLAYLIWLSPYTLAEDEAHYWEWSRHLGWSYYSKGPGVAWVIAAATGLFGESEWAVRLPAVVSVAIGSIASALTARTLFADRRAGFAAAVLYQCVPPFSVLGFIMTIDGPFLACWSVACWTAVKAVRTRSSTWLVATGLALGVGFLFKYTIVLLVLGLIAWALFERRRVRFSLSAWMLAGCAFALGFVPVLIWNAQHDWVTVHHLLGHLGVPGGDLPPTQGEGSWHYSPMWTIEYLGMLLFVGPVGVLGDIGMVKFWRTNFAARVLVAASLPVLLFYLLVTLFARAEGNWALGGFVALVPLGAGVVPAAVDRTYRPIRAWWRLSLSFGIISLLLLPAGPWLANNKYLGHLIPIRRISGMKQLAADAELKLDELAEETGREPFLIAEHYGRASQLAYYMPGHPTVFAAGSMNPAGRKSQYDLWPRTNLRNEATATSLSGRPALVFGGTPEFWSQSFERVVDIGPLNGEPKENRTTFFGYGFHGFPIKDEQ